MVRRRKNPSYDDSEVTLLTKTWGVFPTKREILAIGVWDDDFYMTPRGIMSIVTDIAGISEAHSDLDSFLSDVKKLVRLANNSDSTIARKLRESGYRDSHYSIDEISNEAMSLAGGMMLVGAGVEWV